LGQQQLNTLPNTLAAVQTDLAIQLGYVFPAAAVVMPIHRPIQAPVPMALVIQLASVSPALGVPLMPISPSTPVPVLTDLVIQLACVPLDVEP